MPVSAPADTMPAAHSMPRVANAAAKGASRSISLLGTMPVMTRHMPAYRAVQMTSDPMIPSGRSLPGFRTSSAAVATVSKPTKEKKTMEAAAKMPVTPFGAHGCQFARSTLLPPTRRTKAMQARLTALMTMLKLLLSLMP